MSRMQIKAGEHGIVRLFAIDLALDEAQHFDVDALGTALGGVALDPDHVDLITLKDLDDLGLDGYLIHGLGVAKSEVVQLRPQLRALQGKVALIRSAAFGGMEASLTPKKPLRWIASFGEEPMDLTAVPLKSEAAKGIVAPKAPLVQSDKQKASRLFYFTLSFFVLIAVIMLNLMNR